MSPKRRSVRLKKAQQKTKVVSKKNVVLRKPRRKILDCSCWDRPSRPNEAIPLDPPDGCSNEALTKKFRSSIESVAETSLLERATGQLKVVPFFLTSGQNCSENHTEATQKKLEDTGLLSFIALHKPPMEFLSAMKQLTMAGVFPGGFLVRTLLDMSLFLNEPNSAKGETLKQIMNEALCTFSLVLRVFPTCSHFKSEYSMALVSNPSIKNRFYNHDLMSFLVTEMTKEEEIDDSSEGEDMQEDTDEIDIESSFMYQNYCQWEKSVEKEKFDFSKTKKSKKVLFLLKMLLAMFRQNLVLSGKNRPIASEIFWHGTSESKVAEVNPLIRNIINCFVVAVVKNDIGKMSVLGDLLDVIANCLTIHEANLNENGEVTNFPCIDFYSKRFVKEIKFFIEETNEDVIQISFKVLKNIRTPFIKFLLSDLLLNQNGQFSEDFSAKIVYWRMKQLEWSKCKTMNSKDYLGLSLIHFESFVQVFSLRKFFLLTKGTPNEAIAGEVTAGSSKTCPVDLGYVIRKTELRGAERQQVFVSANLFDFYRSQLKYCYYIGKLVEEYHNSVPELFETWKTQTQVFCSPSK